MAGFEIDTGSTYTNFKTFTFPVLSAGNNAGAANPWGHGKNFPLSKQKFNRNCRASDGRLILPANFQTLVVRLNASGSGEDDWKTNNVSATVAAVDETAPYALNNRITVSPGPYNIGADFYVSVPFSELMEYDTKLDTSWGQAALVSMCTGSNVYTFKGTIDAAAGTALQITGLTTVPHDLFNNDLAGGVSRTLPNVKCADPDYTVSYELAGGSAAAANPTAYK